MTSRTGDDVFRVPGDADDAPAFVGQCLRPDHPNGRGEVVALYPLMADRMYVDRDDKGSCTTSTPCIPMTRLP